MFSRLSLSKLRAFLTDRRFNIAFFLIIYLSVGVDFYLLNQELDRNLVLVNFNTLLLVNTFFLISPILLVSEISVYFLWLLFLDLFILIPNIAYSRFYKSPVPLESYFLFPNISAILENIAHYLEITDFVPIATTALVLAAYMLFFRKRLIRNTIKIKAAIFKVLACVACCISLAHITRNFSTELDTIVAEENRNYSWNRSRYIGDYGIIPYLAHEIYNAQIKNISPPSNRDIHLAQHFFSTDTLQSRSLPVVQRKNVILILVESLTTWATRADSGASMPFLHRLAQEPGTISIPNVLPQTTVGRSSDGQLITLTGLYPLRNQVTVNQFAHQKYPALARMLSDLYDYESLTIVGSKANIWNQCTMSKSYGFDHLYSIDDLKQDEIIGLGISDKSVFRQSISILKNTRQPFFAQIITLSSHDAFRFAAYPRKTNTYTHDPEIDNNLKMYGYLDEALEQFFGDLKTAGLYDNSIIIIAGDHEGYRTENLLATAPELVDPLEKQSGVTLIPLYIVNSGRHFRQRKYQVMGQIDIFPTLRDILKAEHYVWKGLGKSIFSKNPPRYAISSTSGAIGDTKGESIQNIANARNIWDISEMIIRKDVFAAVE